MPTLDEVREAFYEGLLTVPFHRHLGVAIEPGPSGMRATLPPRPEIVGPEGRQSAAALYALGDIASSIRLCEAFIPRALELEMGALFFTVSTSFRLHQPARGTIEASAEMVGELDPGVGGSGQPRKTNVDVEARVVQEDGALVGEQRFSFYLRFMEPSRVREMASSSSLIFDLHGL